MSAILTTLLTAGPSLIRMFGQSKGGKVEQTAEAIADVVELVKGEPPAEQANILATRVKAVDQAALTELKLGLERLAVEREQIQAAREKERLQHDLGMHQEQQNTIRSGDNAEDPYVRQTRPKIVRRSFWVLTAYIFGFEALHAFGKGTGADWEIALVLAAPVLAYFGFRTWDKAGKPSLSLFKGKA
ncbi:hypothetical protein [Bowmanella denitrificans]|uniref:hypothetical protein n=1 Tax=Bowmanella denitrificans TaxID=366582 RepID=UPI000C999470|nr:hypothetical protein [Bowmanella denitrificans]